MKRKNLNWECPLPIVESFEAEVAARNGGRSKWIGATAAMLMYLAADDETKARWETEASSSRIADNAEKTLAKLKPPVKGSPARGPKT